MAYPSTMNSTNISIALAAPLSAPVVNFDSTIDDYYTLMEADWMKLNSNPEIKNNKMLISFGSGARDLLMPSGLTASQDCDVNVLVSFLIYFIYPVILSHCWASILGFQINLSHFKHIQTLGMYHNLFV